MDTQDLYNLTTNSTVTFSDEYVTPYARLFLELFTVVAVFSIVTNVLVIFAILKYKRLREDVTNVIFLHVCLTQTGYLLATPLTLRVVTEYGLVLRVNAQVICALNEIETALIFVAFTHIILLISNWYMKLYNENQHRKFCKVYKFCIATIYISGIFLAVLGTQFCARELYIFAADSALDLTFLAMVIVLIVANIYHKFKWKRVQNKNVSDYGLAIGNIFAVLWLPLLFMGVLAAAGVFSPITLIVMTTVGFSSPIVNFAYLFYYDRNFNAFLKRILKCECSKYDNEALTDNIVVSVTNGTSEVQLHQN